VQTAPKKELTLFDSTCLIMGIIIGVGIYQLTPTITGGAYCWWGAMLLWVAGGAISLCGALGYAELATAYPREGGDYVYLTRAYGGWAGFMFGWVQLAIVRPGDIAVPAFAFAMYAKKIYDPLAGTVYDPASGATTFPYVQAIYACAAAIVLTLINVIGVRQGKWTQNLLVLVKVLGLLAIVGVAMLPTPVAAIADVPTPGLIPPPDAKPPEFSFSGLSLALIFVLFTFGGWNEMAYVAAEVRNPKRNIIRALVLGTVAVTVIYLLVNAAFFHALGYAETAGSKAVAADAVNAKLPDLGGELVPDLGGKLISALICISALGAVNGLIFTGARISYAVGAEHRVFGYLGRWDERTGTPVRALLVQGAIAVALIVVLGSFVDAIIYTACVVYSFYLATTLAVIVLRRKEPQVERPYRVTGYPIPTILFSVVCAYLIYRAVIYKPEISLVSLGIALAGLPIYWLTMRWRVKGEPVDAAETRDG